MITYLQQQQKYKINIFHIIAILLALLIITVQIIQQVKAYPIVSSKSKIINIPSFTRFFSYNNKKNCNILYNKAYQLSYLYNYNSYNFINNNHLQTKITTILKMSSTQSASDNNNSNNKIHDISIHWLRNDLRFHDNPILNKVCNESKTIIPLYIINDINEPFAQTPGIKPNIIRVNFLLESIHEINNKLKQIKYNSNNNNLNNDKSQIIFIIGKYEDVIIKIIEVMNVNAIYYEQDIAEPIRKLDQIVLNKIEQYNKVNAKHNKKCNIITLQTHTIHTMDIYLSKCKDNVAPSSYTGFTKIFQSLKVPKEIDDVTYVPPLPANTINILKDTFTKENNNKDNENNNNKFIYYNNFNIPTLHNLNYNDIETKLKYRHENGLQFIGGENEGIQLLNTMMARHDWIAKFEKPKTSPNSIKVDTTGLSPCKYYLLLLVFYDIM